MRSDGLWLLKSLADRSMIARKHLPSLSNCPMGKPFKRIFWWYDSQGIAEFADFKFNHSASFFA